MSAQRALALATVVVLLGCESGGGDRRDGGDGRSGDRAPRLSHTRSTLLVSDPACTRDECTRVSLAWVVFRDGAAADSLNAWVQQVLAVPLAERDETSDPDSMAVRFLREYRRFRREFSETVAIWTADRDVSVEAAPEGMTSLSCQGAEYTGGAHGLETLHLATFDRATGARLGARELIRPDAWPGFVALAEAAFRRARDLDAETSLSDAGFEFPGGVFDLPEDVMLTRKGLTFHYNPYTIAAYAMGPVTVQLPMADIAPLLRERD